MGSDVRAVVVSNPGCGKIFISCPTRTDRLQGPTVYLVYTEGLL